MTDIKCFERLLSLKDSLEKGEKGDASYFASKLNISERTFYRLLKSLKDDFRLNIEFDRSTKIYYLD